MRADIFTKRFAAGPDWKRALRAIGMHYELPSPDLLFPDPGQNKPQNAGAAAKATASDATTNSGDFGEADRERVQPQVKATKEAETKVTA